MQWMYDKYKLNINKASEILKRRDEMLHALQFEKEFFIVLYEEPEGSPRPRARYVNKSNIIPATQANPGFIQVYSLTGAVDRKFMSQLLTDKELDDFKDDVFRQTSIPQEYLPIFEMDKDRYTRDLLDNDEVCNALLCDKSIDDFEAMSNGQFLGKW